MLSLFLINYCLTIARSFTCNVKNDFKYFCRDIGKKVCGT